MHIHPIVTLKYGTIINKFALQPIENQQPVVTSKIRVLFKKRISQKLKHLMTK